jgi:hypothetical protein
MLNDHCHRVSTQLQSINIIIIIIIIFAGWPALSTRSKPDHDRAKDKQPKANHISLSSEHNAVGKVAFTQTTHVRTRTYRRLPRHWIIQNLSDETLSEWPGDSHCGRPCHRLLPVLVAWPPDSHAEQYAPPPIKIKKNTSTMMWQDSL